MRVAVLAITGLALLGSRWGVFGSAWLPTGMLIDDATYGTTNDNAWAEINKRRLTPEQRNELARKLLDRRLKRGDMDREGAAWLWKQFSSGKLPDELTERFFTELFEPRLVAPERVPAGKPFVVRLDVDIRYTQLPPIVSTMVLFDGLYVGSAAEPIGRRDKCDYLLLLNKPEYAFRVKVPPRPAGKVELRLVFWLAVSSGITPWVAGWGDDGKPWFASTVVYKRRYELKADVLVEDGADEDTTGTEQTGTNETQPATR